MEYHAAHRPREKVLMRNLFAFIKHPEYRISVLLYPSSSFHSAVNANVSMRFIFFNLTPVATFFHSLFEL